MALPSIALASAAAPANAAKHSLTHGHSELKKLPAGKIVGANTATGIHSSYPVDDGDRGHKPDDGWLTHVNNNAGVPLDFTTFAVCRD